MARQSEQLTITARMAGPICLPRGGIMVDALLASAVARRDGLPWALDRSMVLPIEIPIAREPGGRFHLCSSSQLAVEVSELQHTHRRPPIEQYQALAGPKLRTCDISAGENKAYRIARPVAHLCGDEVRWYAVGDAAAIRSLLSLVTHLGKRRAVGLGRVAEWLVEPCGDTWEGFPVIRDGLPLRAIPQDWPGLSGARTGYAVLTYPYWDRTREELLAIP